MSDDNEIDMGSNIGRLTQVLESEGIEPGSQVGYEICKLIYLYHPLGGKMVDRPIKLAMGESRTVHVTRGPEKRLREAFEAEWKAIKADKIIANVARQSRIYGVGAVVMLIDGQDANSAVEFSDLYKQGVTFNVLDPMNTAGSIVLNQDPNNTYHYTGEAVYPHMRSQIINSPDDIDLTDVVVSSSLPVWLGLSQFMPMFPSMLSTQNLAPPYATVKCSNTAPIAGGFYLDEMNNQWQLVTEDVTVSITGLRNAAVEDFLRYIQQYTLGDEAEMGVMNIPVVQDERVTQNELNIIAMRKTIKFKINYYQQRMRNVARQLITKSIPTIYAEAK
ncbi:DUF1073 domain-containing protein [Rahnella perminowiae]|uniref:DUF1073 domain-containing protein n=1 Tax=Rahnella perminowiae TaxID=2816244 RepID=UPI001EE5B52B|nr:DUF1073 domain-containing protein [Rahnella perminowiae]